MWKTVIKKNKWEISFYFNLFNMNKLQKKKCGNQNIPPIKSRDFDQTDQSESKDFFPCILSKPKKKMLQNAKTKFLAF